MNAIYERRRRALCNDRGQDLPHDPGARPTHPRAQLLLTKDFRYFRATGTAKYKATYSLVQEAIERVTWGERVNHSGMLRGQLVSPKAAIRSRFRASICGKPHQSRDRRASHPLMWCGR